MTGQEIEIRLRFRWFSSVETGAAWLRMIGITSGGEGLELRRVFYQSELDDPAAVEDVMNRARDEAARLVARSYPGAVVVMLSPSVVGDAFDYPDSVLDDPAFLKVFGEL